MRITIVGCLIATIGLSAAGCGPSGPPSYEISGKVTYLGQPLPAGTVSFAPDTSKGNNGPGYNVNVKDGWYCSAPGKGIVGGPYKVKIFGFDGKPVPQFPLGKPLFPPYNTEVDLPAKNSTHDFDIPK